MNTNKQTGDTTMNESYKDKFNATMKQFGIDSLDDLKSDEEKKKFFKAVDKSHKAANESVAEELMAIAEETINEIEEGYDTGNTRPRDSSGKRLPLPMKPSIPKPSMDYVGKLTSQMKKEMMKEMDKMPEMKMLKAETDPTKVEMMKKEMMKEMMKEMAEMSEMSEMMKKEMMKEMSKKMNEYGSMNIVAMKEAVSSAQQAAIAISKKEKGMKETHDCNKVHPDQSHSEYMKTESENMEEKHVPGHDDDTSEMMNAMKMNAMKMPITATYGKMNSMKTGDDDLTPMNNMKLNAMIKDPHKSKEDNPKKDLNATYMKSDVRADVKNNGGTDMSKVQDAPKMMTAMKKINAMYKTEKYLESKSGSLNDTLAQMHLDEEKTVTVKVKEFAALVETYLTRGGVPGNLTPGVQEVELNKVVKLKEARSFLNIYNRHFMTNYRAEEFIKKEGGPGSGPQKDGKSTGSKSKFDSTGKVIGDKNAQDKEYDRLTDLRKKEQERQKVSTGDYKKSSKAALALKPYKSKFSHLKNDPLKIPGASQHQKSGKNVRMNKVPKKFGGEYYDQEDREALAHRVKFHHLGGKSQAGAAPSWQLKKYGITDDGKLKTGWKPDDQLKG